MNVQLYRKAWTVCGWTYEADFHCTECMLARFPGGDEDAIDAEGNPIHPVFPHDLPEAEVCADCGALID